MLIFFWSYVIKQGICNKFIEVNFCVGCMVWSWCYSNTQSTPNDSYSSIDGVVWHFPIIGVLYAELVKWLYLIQIPIDAYLGCVAHLGLNVKVKLWILIKLCFKTKIFSYKHGISFWTLYGLYTHAPFWIPFWFVTFI